MGHWRIRRSRLEGEIAIPPSKSQTIRALLFALMAKGKSHIERPLLAPDTTAMLRAVQQLGGRVREREGGFEIEGVAGKPRSLDALIDVGNSGIILRFLGALAALLPSTTILTGDQSIRTQRPVLPLLEGLRRLGAVALSLERNGHAPILIRGPIEAGKTELDGMDSQPVSGLIIAASFLSGYTEITVKNPGEKPWVQLTLSWLDRLGLRYMQQDYSHYTIIGGGSYNGFAYTVPGDFSTAAFPVAAALMTQSKLHVSGLDWSDCQGDKELFSLLPIKPIDNGIHVSGNGIFQGGVVEMGRFIDALPILAVLACSAEKETHLVDAAITRTKECDRVHVMARELSKMGARVEELPDGLKITPSKLKGARLSSEGDHRVAMALAVAALAAEGESVIEDVECVKKTFPHFQEALSQCGADIRCE